MALNGSLNIVCKLGETRKVLACFDELRRRYKTNVLLFSMFVKSEFIDEALASLNALTGLGVEPDHGILLSLSARTHGTPTSNSNIENFYRAEQVRNFDELYITVSIFCIFSVDEFHDPKALLTAADPCGLYFTNRVCVNVPRNMSFRSPPLPLELVDQDNYNFRIIERARVEFEDAYLQQFALTMGCRFR